MSGDLPATDWRTREVDDEEMIDHYGECFVYVIGVDIQNGPQKIGVARDVDRRIGHIQIGCPLPLVINYRLRMDRDSAFQTERQAHNLLKDYRMKGEWFKVTPEMAAKVVRAARFQLRQATKNAIPLFVQADPKMLARWYGGTGRQAGTAPPERRGTRKSKAPSLRWFGEPK